MVKSESLIGKQTVKCFSCSHFNFCLVYWGADCKRQGGNRIPRLKSSLDKVVRERRQQLSKSEEPKKVNNNSRQLNLKLIEPIRTKVAAW